jgi:hypothetical protein
MRYFFIEPDKPDEHDEPDEADEPEEIDETTSIYILDDDDDDDDNNPWINDSDDLYNYRDRHELLWRNHWYKEYPVPEAINEPKPNPNND